MNLYEFANNFFSNSLLYQEDIIPLLKDIGILKSNTKWTPTKYGEDFIEKYDGVVIKNKKAALKSIIKEELNNYLTFEQALKHTKMKPQYFWRKLEELGYAKNEEFTDKARNADIVTSFNLFSIEGIDSIFNETVSTGINNVCVIQWVGPFTSIEACGSWINKNSSMEREFNFYYISGKLSGQGKKKIWHYIGKTERESIIDRLKQPEHKFSEFNETGINIWIGRFSDYKQRSNQKLSDKSQSLKEKEIHDLIEKTEWGLIYGFYEYNCNEDILLNEKKKSKPKTSLSIINRWYKHSKNGFSLIKKKMNWNKKIPDVFFFDKNNGLFFCSNLHAMID